MAIVGLGNDVVQISRFASVRSFEALAKRVLTPQELEQMHSLAKPERFLAKRFAAKEAAAKALGTGIAQGVSFQDLHISNDQAGKPLLSFSGVAEQLAKSRGVSHCHLSISDEKEYAVATVILEAI